MRAEKTSTRQSTPLDRFVGCTSDLLRATVPAGFTIATSAVPLSEVEQVWRNDDNTRRTVFTMDVDAAPRVPTVGDARAAPSQAGAAPGKFDNEFRGRATRFHPAGLPVDNASIEASI